MLGYQASPYGLKSADTASDAKKVTFHADRRVASTWKQFPSSKGNSSKFLNLL